MCQRGSPCGLSIVWECPYNNDYMSFTGCEYQIVKFSRSKILQIEHFDEIICESCSKCHTHTMGVVYCT